jgi:CrcB protein
LLVLCGGAVGSLARFLVSFAINENYSGRFPLATFLINVTGSFFIGLLLVLLDRGNILHPNLRFLLVTGLLGGFTTFSSFEFEVFDLGLTAPPVALSYCIASVAVGWLACWAGALLGRR